jgi:hypothetical protein
VTNAPTPTEPQPESSAQRPIILIDQWTLSELIGAFLRRPLPTLRAFLALTSAPPAPDEVTKPLTPVQVTEMDAALQAPLLAPLPAADMPVGENTLAGQRTMAIPIRQARGLEALQWLLRAIGFGFVLGGEWYMLFAPRSETDGLNVGAPYLLLGAAIWIVAEMIALTPELRLWQSERDERLPLRESASDLTRGVGLSVLAAVGTFGAVLTMRQFAGSEIILPTLLAWLVAVGLWFLALSSFTRVSGGRVFKLELPTRSFDLVDVLWRFCLAALGTIGALLAWRYTSGNQFTLEGVVAWLVSVALWCWALAPMGWSPGGALLRWVAALRSWRPRITSEAALTLLALVAIMTLAANFRFTDFERVPPEMTSDHVEKLLDANSVALGNNNVFFANNHGRDPLQFYLLAAMHTVFGLPLDFNLLKLLTALEGLLTIPLIWLMGRVIIGRGNPTLGNWVGLAAAALVAASGWHVMLSRLGLRIVLTPLVTALLLILLARALRFNRRWDWIGVGVVLGFGVYTYQAVRMLPIVVIAGVGLAVVLGIRNWRKVEGGSLFPRMTRLMLLNLVAAGIVAFVAFVPLFRFSIEFPEDFWRRTSGRLFGDAITQDTDEDGNLIFRQATLEERFNAFQENLPALLGNLRAALLMYNWKGDVAWINNAPNYPTLDPVASALLLVGVVAWLVRMFRRRDPVDWLMLPMILIMLLPSALAIAYPIENPSATRASGTLPVVYLLAGYALALLATQLIRLIAPMPGRTRTLAGGLVVIALVTLVGMSTRFNWDIYFTHYYNAYAIASLPYSDAGRVLRSFGVNGGGFGNAFVIAYPYWWDHRALGMGAGRVDFPNGIPSVDRIPEFLLRATNRTDAYRLDVNKDMLFVYSPRDTGTEAWLRAFFPFGVAQSMSTYQPEDPYMLYRVPPLGDQGFRTFLLETGYQSDE